MFKAYVAHRVGEMHTHTEPRQWLHVPTAEKPADVGTLSISAEDLKECELWWKGPHFSRNVVKKLETTELKETVFMSTMLLTRAPLVDLLKHLHPSHFSVGMIYNGYATCVRKWAMILKAVA